MAAPTAISLIAEKNTDINNFADNLQPNNDPQGSQEKTNQAGEPGYETVLAVSGLLAVIFLVLRQRK